MSHSASEPGSLDKTHREWAQKVIHGNYQPHIDGLRSLAVLPVLVYHVWMGLCPAGFMGVDVFFVISGYLICGGIMRELQAGSFSIASFYFRRIRRIFPAYFAVVVCVLVMGIAIYPWSRILPLAQTALFSTFFSTNIYFWLDMGYFQPNAHGNPLLHLWSLGVEEQFYLIIPIALLVLWKIRRTLLVPALVLGFVASLALCLVLGEMGQSTTAFYILPTRGWELLAGALLTVLPRAKKSLGTTFLSLLGLALVGLSYWCFSTENTFRMGGTSVETILPFLGRLGFSPFPGWVTLPVIAGSLLLLRYGDAGVVGTLLCSRPLVAIGKMSYSLYLWHWPVLVFGRYINYEQQGPMASIVIVAISFLAAYLSWRWIEMPVRVSPRFTPRWAFVGTGVGCAFLAAAGFFLVQSQGLRNIVHERANAFVGAPRPFMLNFKKFTPRRGFQPPAYPAIDPVFIQPLGQRDRTPTFCLVGDSHAEALAPGLDIIAAAHHQSGFYVIQNIFPSVREQNPASDQLLNWVTQHPDVRDIYLVGRWLFQSGVLEGLPSLGSKGAVPPVALDPKAVQAMEDNFRHYAQRFIRHGKRVFVFSCVPEYDYPPADIMARSQIIPLGVPIEITRQDYLHRQAPVSLVLERLEKEGLFKIIPLHAAFFSGDQSVFMGPGGIAYYTDGNHLSTEGARHAVEAVAPMLWPNQ